MMYLLSVVKMQLMLHSKRVEKHNTGDSHRTTYPSIKSAPPAANFYSYKNKKRFVSNLLRLLTGTVRLLSNQHDRILWTQTQPEKQFVGICGTTAMWLCRSSLTIPSMWLQHVTLAFSAAKTKNATLPFGGAARARPALTNRTPPTARVSEKEHIVRTLTAALL